MTEQAAKRKAGRPLTPAQKKARRLVKAHPDWSAAKIAALCGLTRDAVQRDAVYKAMRIKPEIPSKVERAAALVDAGAANQREAARQVGVHESAISKFRMRQKLKQGIQDGNDG